MEKAMGKRFRVGIVGLSAKRGWAAAAHLPALRALSDDFDLIGVANSSPASAESAAAAFGLPRAFRSVAELVASPDIDVVVVTVKVPHHREVVIAALRAGKSVYCEWPLGNGLAEAIELARLSKEKQILGVIGTQSIASPEVQFLHKIVTDGYVGEVLSSTYIGAGTTWGDEVSRGDAYAMDSTNGVTLLSIIGGHAISAVQSVLGPLHEVGAVLCQRRRTVRVIETGETIPMKAPDQVLVNALLQSGAPLSMQLRGGLPRGTRFLWEIHGTAGDLRITAKSERVPVINISPLRVEAGRKGEEGFSELEIPSSYYFGLEDAITARNVAGLYRRMAQDLRHGTHTAPDFDDAVLLHNTVHAIEHSSNTGKRVSIDPQPK
jgi:predicted dehydrogenase